MESGTDISMMSMRENDLPWVQDVEYECFPDPWVIDHFQPEFEY